MLQIWGRQQTKVDAEKHKQTEKAVNSKLATKVAATTAVAAVQQLGRQFEHNFGIKVHAFVLDRNGKLKFAIQVGPFEGALIVDLYNWVHSEEYHIASLTSPRLQS